MTGEARWKSVVAALCAAIAVLGSLLAVDLTHNAVTWHPQGLWPVTAIAMVVYVVALGAFIWALRNASKFGTMVATGLAVVLFFVGLMGVSGSHGTAVKPRQPSPVEFRATRAAVMAIPLAIVGVFMVRRRKRALGRDESDP